MPHQLINCPVCQAKNHKLFHTLESGKLQQCLNCQVIFFDPQPTSEELESFYKSQSYHDYYLNSDMAKKAFAAQKYAELLLKINSFSHQTLSPKNKKLLDIGCASGDLLYHAVQDGWKITGIDISLEPLKRQNPNLPSYGTFFEGDIHSIPAENEQFDLVTAYHVIEHLLDPLNFLIKIKSLLKPNGILFLETPNIGSLGARLRGKHWSHIIPPEHIIYFNPNSLTNILNQAEFETFNVFTASPLVIQSTQHWPKTLKSISRVVYDIAPRLNMGAVLQSIATQNTTYNLS